MMKRIKALLSGLLLGWWLLVRLMDLSPLVLPTPYAVVESLIENTMSGLLLGHMWVTLSEVILGFLLGSVPNRVAHHATCSVLIAR